MEARLFQTNENMDNQEEKYIDSPEQKNFFYKELVRFMENYKNKIYDKENNTIYGHDIDIVEIKPGKIINRNSSNERVFKALKIGHMYLLETKDIPSVYQHHTGYTVEELYNALISSKELLEQIDPLIVAYGYDGGIQTCCKYNLYCVYKEDGVIREL